jgi:hypothetical protein
MSINVNQGHKRVVLHFTASGGVNVAGNSSVSDIALSNEVLSDAYIRRIWWGTDAAAGSWTVKRGSNTVIIVNGSGQMDFSEAGSAITGNSSANVSVTLTGSNGFIMVDLAKIGSYTSNAYSSS